MNELQFHIKLSYTKGLRKIVLAEIKKNPKFTIIREDTNSVYLAFNKDIFEEIKSLRSVARAYIVLENNTYNPLYISNHKSVLGSLIDIVINQQKDIFKSFKISCAGADSKEVRDIALYIEKTYGLIEKEEADLKMHLIKQNEVWEIGIQITARPLSTRDYRVMHMSGAMDPTVAYAMNSLCELDHAESYLNVFSGSGTLLIEAGQSNPNLKRIIGFDNDKKHLSLSLQNIKEAGLIKVVQVKEEDILDKPELGTFDAITSDLPFGMSISKGEDLEKIYRSFLEYGVEKLNKGGRLAVYTSKYDLLEKIILETKLKIIKTLEIESVTSVNSYLKTKIIVCRL